MRFCPAVGTVGGSAVVDEPVVQHAIFGRSKLCTPTVLRIFVDNEPRQVTEVGQIVKRRMFRDHPAFVFLDVQMAAVRAVIDRRYPMLGFPAGD